MTIRIRSNLSGVRYNLVPSNFLPDSLVDTWSNEGRSPKTLWKPRKHRGVPFYAVLEWRPGG